MPERSVASSTPGPRVLFIATYPTGTAPGQRYRFEQYFSAIRRTGGKVKLSPFYSRSAYGIMHGPGRLAYKIGMTLWGLIRRLGDLVRARFYDVVFIYREASPFNFYALEAALLAVSHYSVYDFDDSIWIQDTSDANRRFKFLKSGDKVARIIARADRTLVANPYLEAYARKEGGREGPHHADDDRRHDVRPPNRVPHDPPIDRRLDREQHDAEVSRVVDPCVGEGLRQGAIQASGDRGQRDRLGDEGPLRAHPLE